MPDIQIFKHVVTCHAHPFELTVGMWEKLFSGRNSVNSAQREAVYLM